MAALCKRRRRIDHLIGWGRLITVILIGDPAANSFYCI
jgi:hypothetical protein